MKEYTNNGIMYTWELAGSQGASFILFPTADNTQEQINAAKQELRNSHDVVSLRVASEEDMDDLYKTDYFRDKRVRPLKWYQIEQDEKLIRKARKAGVTIDQFVTDYVLPFTNLVEAKMLEKYGQKMYNF